MQAVLIVRNGDNTQDVRGHSDRADGSKYNPDRSALCAHLFFCCVMTHDDDC